MIKIDNKNIFTEWSLLPVYDNYYNSLLRVPDIKDRIVNDWGDEHGVEVLYTESKLKPREVTISFFCSTIANYESFFSYLTAHPVVQLIDTDVSATRVYKLEYLSCSSFNKYQNFNMFAVKFREANPTDRTA